jgi:hypothetical protein
VLICLGTAKSNALYFFLGWMGLLSIFIYWMFDEQRVLEGYKIKIEVKSVLSTKQYQTFKAKDCVIVYIDKEHTLLTQKPSFNVWKTKTVLKNGITTEDYTIENK